MSNPNISYHDRRLNSRLAEDAEFSAEYERQLDLATDDDFRNSILTELEAGTLLTAEDMAAAYDELVYGDDEYDRVTDDYVY